MTVSTVSLNSSVLLGWYQSFFGGSGTDPNAGLTASSTSASNPLAELSTPPPPIQYAPTAPWNESAAEPEQAGASRRWAAQKFFNPSAAQLDMPGASADYKNLFALYSGLNSLYALATAASGSNVSSLKLSQLSSAFSNGMAQLQTYLGQTSFSKLKLASGVVRPSETTTASTPAQASSYTTTPLNTSGDSAAVVPALEGNVAFTLSAQLGTGAPTVRPDQPRRHGLDAAHDGQCHRLHERPAAGRRRLCASFASAPVPAAPDTISVGGKSVTVSTGQESWGLTLKTNPAETVTLSAPTTGAAVYVGQIVGNQTSTISKRADGRRRTPRASS